MKIIYVAVYDNNPKSGVTKKLIAQVEALNRLGVGSLLILFSNPRAKTFENKYVKFEDFPGPPYKNRLRKFKAFIDLSGYYERLFKRYSFEGESIFLLRNYYPFPSFFKTISKARRKNKIIIDVVSNNIQESQIRKSNYFYKFLLKYYSSKIANAASMITGVTEELVSLNFPKLKSTTPILAISNGFDVESVPLNPISIDNNSINFILVAHLSRWHGLDRLILGFKNYNDKIKDIGFRKYKFNIVGTGSALPECISLVKNYGLEDYFVFHGEKNDRELDELFAKCDLAIGNLATHRKNITITSPLKSKEYCSRGIPFFYSCLDLDFVDFPYAFVVNANEDPINFEEIIRFWDRVNKVDKYNEVMRDYAYRRLTWVAKMQLLTEKLSNL